MLLGASNFLTHKISRLRVKKVIEKYSSTLWIVLCTISREIPRNVIRQHSFSINFNFTLFSRTYDQTQRDWSIDLLAAL